MKKICITHGSKTNGSIMKAFSEAVGAEIIIVGRNGERNPDGTKIDIVSLSNREDVLSIFRSRGMRATKSLKLYQKRKQPFVYVDTGFFYPRPKTYHRLSVMDFQNYTVLPRPSDRWEMFQKMGMKMQPWQKGGRDILICPPTTKTMAGFVSQEDRIKQQLPEQLSQWQQDTIALLREHTDRNIILRSKPSIKQRSGQGDTLANYLDNNSIFAVISLSGCVAPECILRGIPCFVHPTNAAAPVAETDFRKIETPAYPDREEWIRSLSYDMWNIEEIRSGHAWVEGLEPRFQEVYGYVPEAKGSNLTQLRVEYNNKLADEQNRRHRRERRRRSRN